MSKYRGRPGWIDELRRGAAELLQFQGEQQRQRLAQEEAQRAQQEFTSRLQSEDLMRRARETKLAQDNALFPQEQESRSLLNELRRQSLDQNRAMQPFELRHAQQQGDEDVLRNVLLGEQINTHRSRRQADESMWKMRAGLGGEQAAASQAPDLHTYEAFRASPNYAQMSPEARGVFDRDFAMLHKKETLKADKDIVIRNLQDAHTRVPEGGKGPILSDEDYVRHMQGVMEAQDSDNLQRIDSEVMRLRGAAAKSLANDQANAVIGQQLMAEFQAATPRLLPEQIEEAQVLLQAMQTTPPMTTEERHEAVQHFHNAIAFRREPRLTAAQQPRFFIPGMGQIDDTHSIGAGGDLAQMRPEQRAYVSQIANALAQRTAEYREAGTPQQIPDPEYAGATRMETAAEASARAKLERAALVQKQEQLILDANAWRAGGGQAQQQDPQQSKVSAFQKAAEVLKGGGGLQDVKNALAAFGVDINTLTAQEIAEIEALAAK